VADLGNAVQGKAAAEGDGPVANADPGLAGPVGERTAEWDAGRASAGGAHEHTLPGTPGL